MSTSGARIRPVDYVRGRVLTRVEMPVGIIEIQDGLRNVVIAGFQMVCVVLVLWEVLRVDNPG
jgi:hypothetical protein